jgi:hypothetical protein
MAELDEIGEAEGWRCWLCDETVDPRLSSSDSRGASVDARITKARAKKLKKSKGAPLPERLAHVGCNTGKGATDPVVPWPDELFVIDPSPIIAATDRLYRKGGREILARCPTFDDAQATADWLIDRLSRLQPGLAVSSRIDEGGGQYMVSLYV